MTSFLSFKSSTIDSSDMVMETQRKLYGHSSSGHTNVQTCLAKCKEIHTTKCHQPLNSCWRYNFPSPAPSWSPTFLQHLVLGCLVIPGHVDEFLVPIIYLSCSRNDFVISILMLAYTSIHKVLWHNHNLIHSQYCDIILPTQQAHISPETTPQILMM